MSDPVKRTLRAKPHLRIAQHERKKFLEFIFTVEGSFPSALHKQNPSLYSYLFEPRKKGDWINVLLNAYDSRSAAGKSIRLSLRFWLNKLLLNALDTLAHNAISKGKQYDGDIKKEIETLKDILRKKPGPHRSPRRQEQDAIRFATRYEELKPQAKKLKAFVKNQNGHDEKVLGQNAEKELQFQWLSHVTKGDALQHLPTINNNPVTRSSTLNGKWAAWQLSVGVIYCEEKVPNRRIKRGPDTIYEYIRRGKTLLKEGNPANKRA
jgi:hypothetical protein